MEKLIELLNKYLFGLGRKTIIESYRKDSLEDVCGTFRGIVEGKKDYPYTSIWGIEVISKKFGFIKWLVENDKIERRYFNHRNIYISDYGSDDDIFLAFEKGEQGILHEFELEDTILMLLSISDTPIEDLISYLK